MDYDEDTAEGEQGPDGDDITYDPIPVPGGNQLYSIFEDSAVQVTQPGLLSGASDRDTTFPDPDQLSVGSIIELPRNGTLLHNDATGAFTYTPDAGFTGRDWFTWQVGDGGKLGGYSTVFVDVQPLDVSLSIDSLAPGDTSAAIPNQSENNSNWESNATLFLATSAGLPNGSTITLSLDSTTSADIQVWQGVPNATGSTEIFGNGVGGTSHTWTVGTDTIPASLDLLGVDPTDYDQAQFALAVAPATQVVGGSPPASTQPTGNTVQATQPATVPGNSGLLVAFDGTWDLNTDNTVIYQFYNSHYKPSTRKYHEGIGANDKFNGQSGNLLSKARDEFLKQRKGLIPADEAKRLVDAGLTDVQTFYADPSNRGVPLDLIGYSRGAFEALKLASELIGGIPDPTSKKTDKNTGVVSYTRRLPLPPLRFVGIVSAVARMNPDSSVDPWPTSLPAGWPWMYQALDNKPDDDIYKQTTITRAAGTGGFPDDQTQDNHHDIGHDGQVLTNMMAAANAAQVPTM